MCGAVWGAALQEFYIPQHNTATNAPAPPTASGDVIILDDAASVVLPSAGVSPVVRVGPSPGMEDRPGINGAPTLFNGGLANGAAVARGGASPLEDAAGASCVEPDTVTQTSTQHEFQHVI